MFPTKILYALFTPHACYIPCPSHPPYLIIPIIFTKAPYVVLSSHLLLSPSWIQIFFSVPYLKTASPTLYSTFSMRDKVSDPQKAKEINSKIKVLYISTSTF
jgi:hypothetical protein